MSAKQQLVGGGKCGKLQPGQLSMFQHPDLHTSRWQSVPATSTNPAQYNLLYFISLLEM